MRRVPAWRLAVALLLSAGAALAGELPPTGIAYEIEVRLDPASRILDGRETIRWTNPSASPIDRLPVHLYLNAFSHEDTTWIRRSLRRRTRRASVPEIYDDPWGWSHPRVVRQGEAELSWSPIAPDDGNPFDRSLIEIALAEPVAPGETLELSIEFEARLPVPFARTGGYEDFFFAGQWFPKVAVLETVGTRGAITDRWNAHQFHGRTEFYADYADFDVRIGVPEGWPVVATGQGGPEDGPVEEGVAWHRFRQRAVHDFAFSTGARMIDVASTHRAAPEGKPVTIHIFTPAGTEQMAPRWRQVVEGCLDIMGTRIAPYPYDTITVVLAPQRAFAVWGMEYPTLITGLMGDLFWSHGIGTRVRFNESTIAHEYAHQYFYGLIGTNEFEEAFLDEGFTEYWGDQIMIDLFGDPGGGGSLFGWPVGITDLMRMSLMVPKRDSYPPVAGGPSFLLRGFGMGTQFYTRTASTHETASRLFGKETTDQIFARYFEQWSFGHPGLEDFLAVAGDAAGDEVARFYREAFTRAGIPDYEVAEIVVKDWSEPEGHLVQPDGVVSWLDDDDSSDDDPVGLDPAALETDGLLVAEILDPGWVRPGERRFGRIERTRIEPLFVDPDESWDPEEDPDRYQVSEVRLEGSGWDHLPVEVFFRFADGATFRDDWNGRAPYRIYRFVRRAPLEEVAIDPEQKIAMDPDPANNARLREPDRELAKSWAAWFGGLGQLLTEGLWQWL